MNDLATTAVSMGISMSEAENKIKQNLSYWLAPLAPRAGSLPGPLDFSIQKLIAGFTYTQEDKAPQQFKRVPAKALLIKIHSVLKHKNRI